MRAALWLVLAVGLGVTACDGLGGATVETMCGHVCDCLAPFPTQAQQCTDECVAELDGIGVSQVCLDCLELASCPDLQQQDVCETECGFFAREEWK